MQYCVRYCEASCNPFKVIIQLVILKPSARVKRNCHTIRHCGVVVVANIVAKLVIPASLERVFST